MNADHPRAPRGAIILTVDAAAMHAVGHAFYQAANGVRLTDHVPPGYLSGWPG
jgi:putative RNA 2'-phosphotransferase